jgi:hypothetical protein
MGRWYNLADLTNRVGRDRWASVVMDLNGADPETRHCTEKVLLDVGLVGVDESVDCCYDTGHA